MGLLRPVSFFRRWCTIRVMSLTIETDTLAPFEIWQVMLDHSTIKFFEPLILKPKRIPCDPDDVCGEEYWEVDEPELMISTYGGDWHQIQSGVRSDIRDAWRHIVALPDGLLTPNGKKIKQRCLALAEEVFDE